MCENILCFGSSHSPLPLKLLTLNPVGFTFDSFQPRSRLFNCLLLSLVHIHPGCSPCSCHASDVEALLCASTWWGKRTEKGEGGGSGACLLSRRCKLTPKKTLSRSVSRLPACFHPRAPSLFRAVTRGGWRGDGTQSGVGVAFLFRRRGPLVHQTPPASCTS